MGVVTFLILSGFGLTISFEKSGLQNFFQKKITKILIPYSLVTAALLLLDQWILLDIFGRHGNHSLLNVLLNLLGINFSFTGYIDLSMWYITYLLLHYLLFFVVFKLLKNKALILALFALFAFLTYRFSLPIIPEAGYQLYILAFPMGVALGLFYPSVKAALSRAPKTGLALAGIACIGLGELIIHPFSGAFWSYFSSNYAVSLGLIMLVCSMEHHWLKPFTILGKYSYEIYLVEWMLILSPLQAKTHITSNPWLNDLFTFTLIGGVAYLLQKLCQVLIQQVENKRTTRPNHDKLNAAQFF